MARAIGSPAHLCRTLAVPAWVVCLKTKGTVSREEKSFLSLSSFGLPIKGGDIDEDGAVDSGAVFIHSHLNNTSLVTDIYI
jgi:hypothetical protein